MIFLKENGYDEYLAEQIKQGLDDSKAGRVHSVAEVKAEMQAVLEEIARDFNRVELGLANA